jgi:hypothetical protein
MPSSSMSLGMQLTWLLMLAIPVACVAWTVTHEEVFREPREYCRRQTRKAQILPRRKFFYLFTCDYCFSHYVAAIFLLITRFQMLYSGWRGYVVSLFARSHGTRFLFVESYPGLPSRATTCRRFAAGIRAGAGLRFWLPASDILYAAYRVGRRSV